MKPATNIILLPTKDTKYSEIGFFIAAGSTHENDKTGITHLLEHVISANPSSLQIEAETQLEYMAFYSTQFADETAGVLKELHNYLFNIPLDEKNVEIQANRIELELKTVFQNETYQKVYDQLF